MGFIKNYKNKFVENSNLQKWNKVICNFKDVD